jgi:hypothetical protein
MGLNVKINFDDCYDIIDSRADLKLHKFNTILSGGDKLTLGISINEQPHHLLPDVYNLAFGPIDDNNNIDDSVQIKHENLSKTFSTIVLTALTFLNENPATYLGIDGSNNARAYMYYRCVNNNYNYLTKYFKLFGVNYYVRILRKTNDEDQFCPVDNNDLLAIPSEISFGEFIPSDKLYNYFIFKLNE